MNPNLWLQIRIRYAANVKYYHPVLKVKIK